MHACKSDCCKSRCTRAKGPARPRPPSLRRTQLGQGIAEPTLAAVLFKHRFSLSNGAFTSQKPGVPLRKGIFAFKKVVLPFQEPLFPNQMTVFLFRIGLFRFRTRPVRFRSGPAPFQK